MSVCAFNIRGLNKNLKQADLYSFLLNNNLSMAGVLETKFQESNAGLVRNIVHNHWNWEDNYLFSPRGRIWLGWNSEIWDIFVVCKSAQFIHCKATLISSQVSIYLTVVYASNCIDDRRTLWEDLSSLATTLNHQPWAVLGDFNSIQDPHETSGGDDRWSSGMFDFKNFLVHSGLSDIRYTGSYHTWWNKRVSQPITRKLDRVLGNPVWLASMPDAAAVFKPWGISDHCAAILTPFVAIQRYRKPFHFYNYWLEHPDFIDIIKEAWSTPFTGHPLFILAQKLKEVRRRLSGLRRRESNISTQINDVRNKLCNIQESILSGNLNVIEEEKQLMDQLWELLAREESIAKQRSRVQWLELGDSNTAFFHKKVASNWNRNKILSLADSNGHILTDMEDIKHEASGYFESLFNNNQTDYPGIDNLHAHIRKRIDPDQALLLPRLVSDDEIFTTLKSMKKNKSPGPDGFNVNFFLHTWDIVGSDFLKAAHYFFNSGNMPHYINASIIALIPKNQNPSSMNDFRPISCCNTLYKCITKIIATGLSSTLHGLIDKSQAAFVKGRSISDNILIAQEVFNKYNVNSGSSRAAFMLDISKAFDNCKWNFIVDVLILRGYPSPFIKWIHACISSARFSVKVNGESVGYFASSKGIRQGDPLSPFLFVLIMDVLSELLNNMGENDEFKYQHNMKSMRLNHLCFADDLLLFCKGDKNSISLMMQTLDIFGSFSGLKINNRKSSFFVSNVQAELSDWIFQTYHIPLGSLPAKFLGVPLISTGLHAHHCQALVSKICSRIESWVTKFLSFAGRLQLINSVLFGMHTHWSSHFILPIATLNLIQKRLRKFLWNGHDAGRTKAKVSWKIVTLPKPEGSLGIKDMREWNQALIIKHLIAVLNPGTKSLWARWVRSYIIKHSFWLMPCPSNASWILKKLFQLRNLASQHISYGIGNGRGTSLWFDPWYDNRPICLSSNNQLISQSGLGVNATVADILTPDGWSLPLSNYHELFIWKQNFRLSTRFDLSKNDTVMWDDVRCDKVKVSHIWQSLRHHASTVPWTKHVWHKLHVPRYSFLHWLIMYERVNTTDKLMDFGYIHSDNCFFCISGHETNAHLFAECPFFVWLITHTCGNRCVPPPSNWSQWCNWLINLDLRDINNCIILLCFQVVAYSVWHERNNRLFGEKISNPLFLVKDCRNTIKCKLLSSDWFAKESISNCSILDWTVDC